MQLILHSSVNNSSVKYNAFFGAYSAFFVALLLKYTGRLLRDTSVANALNTIARARVMRGG